MRTAALVFSVLLLSACARHTATTGTTPAAAPEPQPAPEPVVVPPAPVPEAVPEPVPVPTAERAPIVNPTLEQAASLAENGQLDQSRRVYVALMNSADVPRGTMAAAARGLYRIGAYADAVDAFRNLGTFRRGEEDLRYYFAISLFETGHYDAAKKELACALPYIELTSDVARYRHKIEQMKR
jgi:hypothetical protein